MRTESDEGHFGCAYCEILVAYPNILVEIFAIRMDNNERVWRREHFSTGP